MPTPTEKIQSILGKVKNPKELKDIYHVVKKIFSERLSEFQKQHEEIANELQETIDKINGA